MVTVARAAPMTLRATPSGRVGSAMVSPSLTIQVVPSVDTLVSRGRSSLSRTTCPSGSDKSCALLIVFEVSDCSAFRSIDAVVSNTSQTVSARRKIAAAVAVVNGKASERLSPCREYSTVHRIRIAHFCRRRACDRPFDRFLRGFLGGSGFRGFGAGAAMAGGAAAGAAGFSATLGSCSIVAAGSALGRQRACAARLLRRRGGKLHLLLLRWRGRLLDRGFLGRRGRLGGRARDRRRLLRRGFGRFLARIRLRRLRLRRLRASAPCRAAAPAALPGRDLGRNGFRRVQALRAARRLC